MRYKDDEEEEEVELQDEDFEEAVPQSSTRSRTKQPCNTKPKSKTVVGRGKQPQAPAATQSTRSLSLMEIPITEFRQMRKVNQYQFPPDFNNSFAYFHTKFQERVYKEVLLVQENKVVIQKYIDVQHMNEHPQYFSEAKAMCEEMGLLPLMQFQYDYDESLVLQFYATVHFGSGPDRELIWMTKNERKKATMAEIGRAHV